MKPFELFIPQNPHLGNIWHQQTLQRSEPPRSARVCRISSSPNPFPEEGEAPHIFIPYFAHWTPQVFCYNGSRAANLRHSIHEWRSPHNCNCFVWTCLSKYLRDLGYKRRVQLPIGVNGEVLVSCLISIHTSKPILKIIPIILLGRTHFALPKAATVGQVRSQSEVPAYLCAL